jgi:hypothetical protein
VARVISFDSSQTDGLDDRDDPRSSRIEPDRSEVGEPAGSWPWKGPDETARGARGPEPRRVGRRREPTATTVSRRRPVAARSPQARARRPARPGRAGSRAARARRRSAAIAREICLRLLTDRARTRQELASALARKGVPAEAAAEVLDRFGEVGLIDDAAFAGQWVRSRTRHRGLGRRAIAVELRRKGVADESRGRRSPRSTPSRKIGAPANWSTASCARSRSAHRTSGRRPPGGWSACSPARATGRVRRVTGRSGGAGRARRGGR